MLMSQLWIVNVATGVKRLLTEGRTHQPHWSPTGYRITYWGINGGQADIWTMPAGGGVAIPVTNDTCFDWNSIWSPDGGHIYFSSDRGGNMNLWRVRIDEETGTVLGEPEPVTTGVGTDTAHLTISQNGRKLAYSTVSTTNNIQKISFDPVKERVVGEPVWVTNEGAMCPDVAPDGEWIAFSSYFGPPPSAGIGIIRTDGTGLRRLTDSPFRDMWPRWSPDGQRIYFRSNRTGGLELWSINADGSGLMQHTKTKGVGIPVCSPDGLRLAIQSKSKDHTSYIIEADKSWEEQTPKALPPFEDVAECSGVYSWSPDGEYLASEYCFALFSFESETYVRPADFGANPRWLSDSRRVLISATDDSSPIFLFDIESERYHEVLSSEILSIAPDIVRPWPAISPDDRTIYFGRRRREADIWMLTLNEEQK
jgi:Tol biopolymer transport system component